MKRLFTFLLALLLTWIGASAQSAWTAPQPTTSSLTSGTQYYVYNVGYNGFLVNGNNYLTQASVGPQGLVATVTEATGGWTIMFATVVGTYDTYTNCYLYYTTDGGGKLWCDQGTLSTTGYFNITDVSELDDTYIIVSSQTTSTYVGWEGEGSTIVSPVIAEVGDNTYWQFITPANYEVYLAKLDLYDVLVEAEEMGMESDTDYQNAGDVYTSSSSTVAEIEAAIEALELAMESHASADHPVDVTNFYITNPSFDTGNLTGWSDSFGYQSTPHANGEITISGYAETWVASNSYLSNKAFSQTLELPKGTYRLEADAVATQQGNESLTVSGVYLCAGSQMTSVHTGNGLPEHYTVEFYVTNENGESADIGMKIYNTDANWVAVDNFVLYYLGEEVTAVTDTESEYKKGDVIEIDGGTYYVQCDNMVQNHSFELGFDGWTEAVDFATGITFTNFELRSDAKDGKVCLVGTTNTGSTGAGSLGTAWAIESGKTYYFSYWVKALSTAAATDPEGGVNGGYLKVSVTNNPGSEPSGTYTEAKILIDGIHVGEEWQQVEVSYTNESYKYLQVDFRWLDSNWAFDNFQLYEIDEDLLPVDWEMTEAGWGTLILPFEAEVPNGLTLYAGDALTVSNSELTVGEASESIEANVPYLVSGTEGTYSFTGAPTNTDDSYTAGMLVGTLVDMTQDDFTANSGQYVLQNHEDEGLAFYPITDESTGVTLDAYHCYLTSAVSPNAVKLPGMATAIEAVESDVIANDVIYDLSGRRVAKAVKGVYIMNGKKVLVK